MTTFLMSNRFSNSSNTKQEQITIHFGLICTPLWEEDLQNLYLTTVFAISLDTRILVKSVDEFKHEKLLCEVSVFEISHR